MSSNHKAPLTAFVVVAIACVVVLATNSMRSYAKDAWRSFAAPVVAGLQLMEIQQGETLQPSTPAKPAAPATVDSTPVVSSPAQVLHLTHPSAIPAAHITRGFHAHPVVPVHSQPKQPVAPATPVNTVKPVAPATSASHGGPKHDPVASTATVATPISGPDHGWGAPHGHAAHGVAGPQSHGASKHGSPTPVVSTRSYSYSYSGPTSTAGPTMDKGHGPAHGGPSATAPGRSSHTSTAPGNSGFGHGQAPGMMGRAHAHRGH